MKGRNCLVLAASTLDGFCLSRSTRLLALGLGLLLAILNFLELQLACGLTFRFLLGLAFLQGGNIHATDSTGELLHTASALQGRGREGRRRAGREREREREKEKRKRKGRCERIEMRRKEKERRLDQRPDGKLDNAAGQRVLSTRLTAAAGFLDNSPWLCMISFVASFSSSSTGREYKASTRTKHEHGYHKHQPFIGGRRRPAITTPFSFPNVEIPSQLMSQPS